MITFNTLHFGDVHLGLETNPAPNIIKNLRKTIHPVVAKENISIVFIQGDLTEKLIFLNDKYLFDIDIWLAEFISLCALKKTKIVVLEGTPRHDRKQSARLVTIANMIGHSDTVSYIDELCIVYEAKIKKHVLYVPDVIRDSAETTFNDILSMMENMHLESVDVAIMHGAFEHQMPIKDKHTHCREAYEKIVKDFICINHVHKESYLGKVIAPGSFDCTEHGLTGPFGAVKVTHLEDNKFKTTRIINKTPMTFVSYTLKDDNKIWLEREVNKAIDNSDKDFNINVSIKMELTNENKAFYEYLKNKYENVRWTLKPIVNDLSSINKMIDAIVAPSSEITKNNVSSLVRDKLQRNGSTITNEVIALLEEYVNE